jgi:hypothetical protein
MPGGAETDVGASSWTTRKEDDVKKTKSLVSLALPIGIAILTACSGSPDGAGSAVADTTQTATAASSEMTPAMQSRKVNEGQLLARKSFNGGTETVSLYNLGGAFGMEWTGNPRGGHSVVARAFNELRLSEMWELIAAPGQEAPPALAEAMATKPPRADKMSALVPVLSGSASTDVGTEGAVGAPVEHVRAFNYCNNGGFWTDWGVPAGATEGGGWFWADPNIIVAGTEVPSFGEYADTQAYRGVSYSHVERAGFAVCPTNDWGSLNGAYIAPGVGYGVKVWSWSNCGQDLFCCWWNSGCQSCSNPGTDAQWTWVDSCPQSNGQCTDGNQSSIVTYQVTGGSGCVGGA